MPGRRPDQKNKIIQLLREGETSSVIIANKVKSNVAYVDHVKDQLLQECCGLKEPN
jgi:hypothetical protein